MAIVCLAKISPMNPATGSRVDIYASSANDRNVTGLNGVVWEPAMTTSPTLSINLWQGDFKEPVDTGGASFAVHMGILKMSYANADTYNWAGAPVEIYAEESGTAWPWTQRFKGRIASYARRIEVLTINATIDTEPFDKDVLTATYAGTGGAEGSADLKGRLKPLIIGWADNVEPVLINTVDNVYQFSGYGAIEGVTTLYERAADFGASTGDHASYAALVAASIPAGRWATCLAAGMIRLGAPAAGVITGDIKGHKVSTTTPRLTGAVINALATIAGVSSGNIETATLTSLDSAVAYPINLVLTDQVKWRDMASGLALACNWQSGITLTGKWFAAAVTLSGSEVMTLNAQGTALPQVTTSDEADVSVPYHQTIFGADRCWRVQTSDEIAFTAELLPLGLYDDAVTYREGNIVDLADGSTWIYINAVASAGNDPPAWPTTSNLYWSNRTPPTNPASIGAATAAEVAAALALAQSKGKVWTGATIPTVAESNVGDTWIGPDGTFYERVNEGGILLGGFAITLGGFRPRIAWTLAANQALRDVLIQSDEAYASANDAIDQLIGLADDDLISRNEKITKLVPEVSRLEEKWTALSTIAASLSVSTTAASSARSAWNGFLGGLSPAWNDTSQDTVVVRATFNSVRDAYDLALYDLDREVKAKAATVATWAGVSGSGRPADNATVGAPSGTSVGGVSADTVASGANAANAGLNADGTVKTDKVGTQSVVSGALSGTTIVSASGSSAAFAAVRELAYITIPTLPAGTVGIRLGLYGQIKDVGSGYTPGYPMLRLYRVSAANASTYLASSPRDPSVLGVPMNRNITLPNWSNIDMGGTLLFNTTTPAAGDLYVLGIDVVTNPPSAGSWAWNWRADIALDIVKR